MLLLAVSKRFDEGQKADILQGIERLLWFTLLGKADIRARDARWNRVNESLQAGKTIRCIPCADKHQYLNGPGMKSGTLSCSV